MNNYNAPLRTNVSKRLASAGLMLAVIVILTALEHMLPPLPFLPPNVKPGLSNVITMYCVFFVSRRQAVTLNALKSFFVLLLRRAAFYRRNYIIAYDIP
jgi:heptaprenyl diphosphate synthase